MSALSDAARGVPFANGTERRAWEDKWCSWCERDHNISHAWDGNPEDERDLRCPLLMRIDLASRHDDFDWPESWLPEPDDGRGFLPSRLVCESFKPCHVGTCTGDPGAEARAERVEEVRNYWRRLAANRLAQEVLPLEAS